MPTAKKPKVENAEPFHSAENSSDDDDDDDLFISVWDGKSSKNNSSNAASTKSKPKVLPNTSSIASGSTKSRPSASVSNENVTSVNNVSCSTVSPRKIQNQNSSNNSDFNSSTNGNGQASISVVDFNNNNIRGSQNGSCSGTNSGDKTLFPGHSTSDLQNQDSRNNDNNLSAIDGNHTSLSVVDSSGHSESSVSKSAPYSAPIDWDKPSCSGINIGDFDFVDLSLETDVSRLKAMFPSLDEEVLKSYLASYQDIEECVRVISTFMFGGDDDDIFIYEDIKHSYSSDSESIKKTDQTINCSVSINTHEDKSPSSYDSKSSTKKDKSVESPGENGLQDHSKIKSIAVKSQRNLDDHDIMVNKAPLSSNSREITSDSASSSSLHTMRRQPSSTNKQKPGFKETVTLTNGEKESKLQKSDQIDTKPCTSQFVPSTGIDIRFGKNKVHPSMKRCLDRSLASRDIAKPYQCNTDVNALPNSSDPSPSKRICKDSSSPTFTISYGHTTSGNSKGATTPSKTSSTSSVSNSSSLTSKSTCSTHSSPTTSTHTVARSGESPSTSRNSSEYQATNSPSKQMHGQCSTNNSPRPSPTITCIVTRSNDTKGSLSTSRNSYNDVATNSPLKQMHGQCSTNNSATTSTYTVAGSSGTNSPKYPAINSSSKKTFGHTSKYESAQHNSSRSDDLTSRNTSEDSTTNSSPTGNMGNRSQLSSSLSTDLSSVINQIIGINRRMLGSQGSPISNHSTAGMPSKKGKDPKSSALVSVSTTDANQEMRIDWGNVVNRSSVQQLPSPTPIRTTSGQPTGINQEATAHNGNQYSATTSVKQENQIQSTGSSPTNAAWNRLSTGYSDFNPENIVLVVKKEKSDANECISSSSDPQNLADSSQQEEPSAEEKVARQEMLDLQRDTEMLAKVCPESDPNYIFSRLEELKDKPNRIAIVNRELIENASTSQSGGAENVIQKEKKIVWFWEDKKMRRIPFSRAESNIIESKYSKHDGTLVRVQFSPDTLVLWFNFDSMALRETLRDKIRHVYRTESIEEIVPGKDDEREETGLSPPPLSNPETWHGHSTNNTNTAVSRELFEVLPGTSEFAHVAGLLKKSLVQAVIKKIKRVKNDWLERKYGIQRSLLREKNGPGGINEMELFHGTRQTPPAVVWNSEEGFDMRYSADGMWGRGCYFAVHAGYSHHQFTHQYVHKQKRYYQIFLAHVLTGESINMNPDRSIRKPPLNVATGRHYDSVTGITQGHRIYVLYKNEASFPAYLITYSM